MHVIDGIFNDSCFALLSDMLIWSDPDGEFPLGRAQTEEPTTQLREKEPIFKLNPRGKNPLKGTPPNYVNLLRDKIPQMEFA
ncbi:hypothetical protein PVPAM_030008500 [Plasmodium vivax]|nr:hypothetical protein PVPAM_030008500 [Plasmodium vivax]